MPRQQAVRIDKVPQVQVERGSIGVGQTQTVNMPIVKPEVSDSAKLAEAFGMAVKATGTVVQNKNQIEDKKWSVEQGVEGTTAAVDYVEELKLEADKLPLEQRTQFMRDGLHRQMDTLRQNDVSSTYLSSYMNAFVNKASAYEANVREQEATIRTNEKATKLTTHLQSQWEDGELTQWTGVEDIMTMMDVNRQVAGKMYVEQVSAFILEKVQTTPGYNAKADIDNLLKVTTKDGINYATHTVYGPMIDKLEGAVATAQKATKDAAESGIFAGIYNNIRSGFQANDLVAAAKTEQDILASGLPQSQVTYLLSKLEDKKKGKLIDDNFQSVASVKNYVATHPELVVADLTAQWFQAQGIWNPENQDEIRTMANSSGKMTASYKIFHDKLDTMTRTNQFGVPGEQDQKRAAILADYETAVLLRHEDPNQAYLDVMAKYAMKEPSTEFAVNTNTAIPAAIGTAQTKINELLNNPGFKTLPADKQLEMLRSIAQ